MAKQAFINLKGLFRSDISLELRKRLLKCYVWSVLLYGCEAWSMSKAMKKRLEAFEMWCYRRICRVSYTDHMSNDAVLLHMSTSRKILRTYRPL